MSKLAKISLSLWIVGCCPTLPVDSCNKTLHHEMHNQDYQICEHLLFQFGCETFAEMSIEDFNNFCSNSFDGRGATIDLDSDGKYCWTCD